MKRIFLALVMLLAVVAVSGCGDDDHHHRHNEISRTQTLSDETQDAYIARDQAGNLTITDVAAGAPSVLAGINPATGVEYRAFLDFPLGGVPGDAIINSAFLTVLIRNVVPTGGSVPLRIELVDFTPPLLANYFFRDVLPPLAAVSIVVPVIAVGSDLDIDITPLMEEAQFRGFSNLQLRIMQELGSPFPGLVEIDDTGTQTAPLLTVDFF